MFLLELFLLLLQGGDPILQLDLHDPGVFDGDFLVPEVVVCELRVAVLW